MSSSTTSSGALPLGTDVPAPKDAAIDPLLLPLLNAETLQNVREHVQAVRALAFKSRDRQLATGLELLLENHDLRLQVVKGRKP